MRKYDLPSHEDEEYTDALDSLPKNIYYLIAILVLTVVFFYCAYLMLGTMNLIISTLIVGSIIVLFLYIRKGILTARKNNIKNGKIPKTPL